MVDTTTADDSDVHPDYYGSYHQYRVQALVKHPTGHCHSDTITEMDSHWMDEKERAVALARTLEKQGYSTEIKVRERGGYAPKAFDVLPE